MTAYRMPAQWARPQHQRARAPRSGLLSFVDAVPTMPNALRRVSRLTAAEVRGIMQPIKAMEKHLREGVATEEQVIALHTHLRTAMAIEDHGPVRGLRGHLQPAIDAIKAIHARGLACGDWVPVQLTFAELDDLKEGIEMIGHQLAYISARELHQAVERVIQQAQDQGEESTTVQPEEIGLQAAGAAA